MRTVQPLAALAPLRAAVEQALERDERSCVQALIAEAELPEHINASVSRVAATLACGVREARAQVLGVDTLIQAFPLDSEEGVALMCLAEALLRIPDVASVDRLIEDRIVGGNWQAHLGRSPAWLVNASAWGLLIAGKLLSVRSDRPLLRALARAIRKGGAPLIRRAMCAAMSVIGRQFVVGQTIEQALNQARASTDAGYRFSFDMLGEAALNAQDAAQYTAAYTHALHVVGAAAQGKGVMAGPSVSVKLSALHPRYTRAQRERVLGELAPRLEVLFVLAKHYDIALSVDAEEAERLDLSLDVMEAIARAPALSGFNGIGFVVQAYDKRAPYVIDWIIGLARATGHRFMVRLVKGAYWDAQIKRAQAEGWTQYPVYTRKFYTDVAYLACARRLFMAQDAVYPQFATHNAHTVAAIHAMGQGRQYEFQCLYGMGESLYDQIVGAGPGAGLYHAFGDDFDETETPQCRVYAPVGAHHSLLPYLVRRLLENGALTSFAHRVVHPAASIQALVSDPVAQAKRAAGKPHPDIELPEALYGADRRNALGLNLAQESSIARIQVALTNSQTATTVAMPLIAGQALEGARRMARNPSDPHDAVGVVMDTPEDGLERALACALAAFGRWSAVDVNERAACLVRAAQVFEQRLPEFVALAVREAGKTWADAVSEVREAVDFLRYYAQQAKEVLPQAHARGPIVAISPWNFPLAIFIGQVSAALVAGNTVLAKPAEQTPLIAAAAVHVLHEAGVPSDALQFLPGDGPKIGAALVRDERVAGVLFTGSTQVAKDIQRALAQRAHAALLIAETGGINAMIVDSTALPEQVVADVLASAFNSAGQRCSALRLLCLQEEIADRICALLKGAMDEWVVGDPRALATDVGPIIDAHAQGQILSAIEELKTSALWWHQTCIAASMGQGHFVPPIVAEVERVQDVRREIFGPVLHVVRYSASKLDALIDAINANGYGLTHGVHSRMHTTIARVCQRIKAGNVYINRNMIGAVVGLQPFGGLGLSGTGPKAGGPLYLRALVRGGAAPPHPEASKTPVPPMLPEGLQRLAQTTLPGLDEQAQARLRARIDDYKTVTPLAWQFDLGGPTGERNVLSFNPLGWVACMAEEEGGHTLESLALLAAAALACGNRIYVPKTEAGRALAAVLGADAAVRAKPLEQPDLAAVLWASSRPQDPQESNLRLQLAHRQGAIVPLISVGVELRDDESLDAIDLTRLVAERTYCTNTAAWGGDAALMRLADQA